VAPGLPASEPNQPTPHLLRQPTHPSRNDTEPQRGGIKAAEGQLGAAEPARFRKGGVGRAQNGLHPSEQRSSSKRRIALYAGIATSVQVRGRSCQQAVGLRLGEGCRIVDNNDVAHLHCGRPNPLNKDAIARTQQRAHAVTHHFQLKLCAKWQLRD
jgi:hypothetical protein